MSDKNLSEELLGKHHLEHKVYPSNGEMFNRAENEVMEELTTI